MNWTEANQRHLATALNAVRDALEQRVSLEVAVPVAEMSPP